jgi:predicted PhzF superfamily epimerase YddE/YHI9
MSARANLFQVVTFATDPQQGNPAFVLSGVQGIPEPALMIACSILRADVLAVLDEPAGGETPLRFFTSKGLHGGAGHATLAAAHVVLHAALHGGDARKAVTFNMPDGGRRLAQLAGERIAMDFPAMPASRIDRVVEMAAALGARPAETWVAPFGYVAVFAEPRMVAQLRPNLERVAAFDRTAVIATAPGRELEDVVIRVFAPNVGLPEDPVCGTAHRIIVPYWAQRLGKKQIHSRQLSARGGDLWCEDKGDVVEIAGESRLVIDGTIRLPD